jgi:hypothetical protein
MGISNNINFLQCIVQSRSPSTLPERANHTHPVSDIFAPAIPPRHDQDDDLLLQIVGRNQAR